MVEPAAVTRHAPDIVVEVLSPSTAAVDRGRKMRTFARHAVPECWIVDPIDRGIEVHTLEDGAHRQAQVAAGDDAVRSALLPDVRFDADPGFEFRAGRP